MVAPREPDYPAAMASVSASPRPVNAAPLAPIVVAVIALGVFGAMDGVMKAATLALGAYTAMLWRSGAGVLLMGPIVLGPVARGRRRLPDRTTLLLHARRGAVGAGMATLFFYGLARTPMAEAMALSFIAPLIALYLAAALLGEKVTRATLVGSLCAFAGVAVIAQGKLTGPSDPERIRGLVAVLVSALLYAWNLVLQRQQAQIAAPREIAFYQAFFCGLCLLPFAPWFAGLPHGIEWALVIAGAGLAAISVAALGWAYARAEAQVLVPLEYTAFVWAALIGWLAFDEALTWRTLVGVAAIVAGCLIAARRAGAEKFEAPPPA